MGDCWFFFKYHCKTTVEPQTTPPHHTYQSQCLFVCLMDTEEIWRRFLHMFVFLLSISINIFVYSIQCLIFRHVKWPVYTHWQSYIRQLERAVRVASHECIPPNQWRQNEVFEEVAFMTFIYLIYLLLKFLSIIFLLSNTKTPHMSFIAHSSFIPPRHWLTLLIGRKL